MQFTLKQTNILIHQQQNYNRNLCQEGWVYALICWKDGLSINRITKQVFKIKIKLNLNLNSDLLHVHGNLV